MVCGDADRGAEECGEGEERAGDGLGCSVTGEEGRLRDPAGGDDSGFEQWQDYVASTEDERSAAIEGGGERGRGLRRGWGQEVRRR